MKIVDLLDVWGRERDVHFRGTEECDMFVAAPDFIRHYFPDLNVVSFMEDIEGDLIVATDSFDEKRDDNPKNGTLTKTVMFSCLKPGDKFYYKGKLFIKTKLSHAFDGFDGLREGNFSFCLDTNVVWNMTCDYKVEVPI